MASQNYTLTDTYQLISTQQSTLTVLQASSDDRVKSTVILLTEDPNAVEVVEVPFKLSEIINQSADNPGQLNITQSIPVYAKTQNDGTVINITS
jgi:hypothetical protein